MNVQPPQQQEQFKTTTKIFNGPPQPFLTYISKRHRNESESENPGQNEVNDDPIFEQLQNVLSKKKMDQVFGNPMLLCKILDYFDKRTLYQLRLINSSWNELITKILVGHEGNSLTFKFFSQNYFKLGSPKQDQMFQQNLTQFQNFIQKRKSELPFPCSKFILIGDGLESHVARSFFSLHSDQILITKLTLHFNIQLKSISQLGIMLELQLVHLTTLEIYLQSSLTQLPEKCQLFPSTVTRPRPSVKLDKLQHLQLDSSFVSQESVIPILTEILIAASNLKTIEIPNGDLVLQNSILCQQLCFLIPTKGAHLIIKKFPLNIYKVGLEQFQKFSNCYPQMEQFEIHPFSFSSLCSHDRNKRLEILYKILEINSNFLQILSISIVDLLTIFRGKFEKAGRIPKLCKLKCLYLNSQKLDKPQDIIQFVATSLIKLDENFFSNVFPSLQNVHLDESIFQDELWDIYLQFFSRLPKSVNGIFFQLNNNRRLSFESIFRGLQQNFEMVETVGISQLNCLTHLTKTALWEFGKLKKLFLDLNIRAFILNSNHSKYNKYLKMDKFFTGFNEEVLTKLRQPKNDLDLIGIDSNVLGHQVDKWKALRKNSSLVDLTSLEELRIYIHCENAQTSVLTLKPHLFSETSQKYALDLMPNLRMSIHVPDESFSHKRDAEICLILKSDKGISLKYFFKLNRSSIKSQGDIDKFQMIWSVPASIIYEYLENFP